MKVGIAVSPYASSVVCQPRIPSISQQRYLNSQPLFRSLPNSRISRQREILGFNFRCNSSTNPGGASGPEENDTKAVLDAFFLGKALAEAVSERVESTVGEFLSTIGRLQAEQQKQVQSFQEEVLERAKKAKEKAAREAMEPPQGLVSRSSSYVANEFKDESKSIASQATTTFNSSSSSSVQPATSNSDPIVGED